MRISDWSSDVCSSDLFADFEGTLGDAAIVEAEDTVDAAEAVGGHQPVHRKAGSRLPVAGDADGQQHRIIAEAGQPIGRLAIARSEEHTSELQSLMRISYAVFCLKKKNNNSALRLDRQSSRLTSSPQHTQRLQPTP